MIGASRRAGRLVRRRSRRARKRLLRSSRRLAWWRLRPSYAHTLARVPSRDELPIVLNQRGLLGTGVEIGVKKGGYSEVLLARWGGRRLISVDPWLEAGSEEYVDRANVPQDEHERFYRRAVGRLARFGERSQIWRLTSLEAAERIPDASLDFAYIDARHDYDSVLEDLEAWHPKVRPGGIIAGHDYVDGEFIQGVFGVRRAVDEYFGARGLEVHQTNRPDPLFPSWLVEVTGPRRRHRLPTPPHPGSSRHGG